MQNFRLLGALEAKNSNKALFDRNLELRDNGTITIGSLAISYIEKTFTFFEVEKCIY